MGGLINVAYLLLTIIFEFWLDLSHNFKIIHLMPNMIKVNVLQMELCRKKSA